MSVYREEDHGDHDDRMPNAPEVVDGYKVPKGPGPPRMLQERPASQLCHNGIAVGWRFWFIFGGAVGPHAPVGGVAVERRQQ